MNRTTRDSTFGDLETVDLADIASGLGRSAIDLVPVPLEELWAMVTRGEIQDCKSIAALALARAHLSAGG